MMRKSLQYLSESQTARRLVTNAPLARSMAQRFVAGETLDDAVRVAQQLNRDGLLVSLDFLGELIGSRQEALAATEMAIRSLHRLHRERIDGNISLKPTQLGIDVDEEFCLANLERILRAADELHPKAGEIFVRLDMEASDYTERTIRLVEVLWERGFRNVGTVVQSYLRRAGEDIRRLNGLGSRVRLVKGAYQEPASVAYQRKVDVDRNFQKCMEQLLLNGVYPAIATHDEEMIAATRRFAYEHGIHRDTFEFQMLYGVRRDLQRRLREEGYFVRVYVPYGDSWYPYLMRRMAERPANFFFVAGSVAREAPTSFINRPAGLGAGVIAGVLAANAWRSRNGG